MRDFFTRQQQARSKSAWLIALFALACTAIVLIVYFAACVFIFYNQPLSHDTLLFWDSELFAATCGGTLLIIASGSLYKISELSTGGASVAELLGGRRLAGASAVPEERQLLNVVEEMAIASGVPVPAVYVLDRERGINAFAAGFGLDDAVICVTKGALLLLTREELQGVVAHEFSHLLNSDTLINIRVMGVLHGILSLALVGRFLLRGSSGTRGRSAGPFVLVGVVLFLLGSVGVFFGNLIKSALSRQRENLADAAAVQFTRNPLGLAGALKKVGSLSGEGVLSHPQALAASHMFFCDGLGNFWLRALTTHPPLLERIRALDPQFDGRYPRVEPLPVPVYPNVVPAPRAIPAAADTADGGMSPAAVAAILASVGAPMQLHAAEAHRLMATLPPALRSAAREQTGACAVIYALLLDRDETLRDRQLACLRAGELAMIVDESVRLADHISQLSLQLRLPLVDLALPALRSLSAPQYAAFKDCVQELIRADGKTTLFEFALQQALLRHLDAPRAGAAARPRVTQIYGMRGVAWECSCVLSLLARAGHRDQNQAAAAFASGSRVLREKRVDFAFLPLAECAPSKLTQALQTLDAASPPIKRKLLAACLVCLTHDQTIAVEEAELFRAIADALGSPVPPWLTLPPASAKA